MSEDEQPAQPPRRISDPQTMRAVAHPVRLELLDLMRREGDITATRAAEALGESPGNMSWHLQTLAKYGFVEETGAGKGRSRPWRLVSPSNRFTADIDDPGANAAGTALAAQVLDRATEKQRQWLAARPGYGADWRDAAFLHSSLAYLTAEELAELRDELVEMLSRYNDRAEKRSRPADALPVNLTAFGHPLPPTDSGN